MFETSSEVSEVKESENREDTIDSDFEKEMNDKYDDFLSGKSKEELQEMRNEVRSWQMEQLKKELDELLEYMDGDDSEGDESPEKVLTRYRHR